MGWSPKEMERNEIRTLRQRMDFLGGSKQLGSSFLSESCRSRGVVTDLVPFGMRYKRRCLARWPNRAFLCCSNQRTPCPILPSRQSVRQNLPAGAANLGREFHNFIFRNFKNWDYRARFGDPDATRAFHRLDLHRVRRRSCLERELLLSWAKKNVGKGLYFPAFGQF